ncbi:uncharacterized protein LOC131219242 isoform X2 [Magnolia sinica]|uniref:uncharacterized protein LOC131219242 isoform X2 n=1 Tax=Magnolia sinica TaxID=86752 RepID=UPI002658E5D8|nr:uncharacterized protein LOC131219242 isoform X2 [Magnolia sinica]
MPLQISCRNLQHNEFSLQHGPSVQFISVNFPYLFYLLERLIWDFTFESVSFIVLLFNMMKSKGVSSDNTENTVTSSEDVERPDRTAAVDSSRPWADLPPKMHNMHHPQREQLDEPAHEKSLGAGYGDNEFVSDLPQLSDLGAGKANDRVAVRRREKPLYGTGSSDAETTAAERNGSDISNAYGNYQAPRPSQALTQMHAPNNMATRSSKGMLENWKNSEEKEYMWEDMNSRLKDHGGAENSQKDGWNYDGVEKPISLQRGKWMP